MTDAKPVAERIDELEREAADVEDISPLAIRGAFERLAALARRLLAERDAAERACDENAVEVMRLQGELAEVRARISNEVAARQRAQEHGIGDRARIEELERERDALQVALNNVSGALVDSGVPVPIEVRYGEAVRGIVRERDGLRGHKRSVDEALNSGDGVYRP